MTDDEREPGDAIVTAAWAGTVLFVAGAVAGAVAPDSLGVVSAGIDLALFAVGCVAFLAAFARVVGRSRTEEISVVGVYFLAAGAAPGSVRTRLLGALAVEVVVAVATAAVRPYTELAFGVLVPVYGLGLIGLWASRHGTFPPRVAPAARSPRSRGGDDGAE